MRTLFLLSIAGLALAQAPPEPTDIQGWIRQSLELARAGKQDDALKAINRGLELDANNLAALHTLAYVQFNKGMLQQARDTYQKILLQKPDSREALYGLGAVAAVNVEAARKQARAEAGLAMDAPGPIPIAGTRAQYQNEIGPIIQEGIQNLERALQIDPAFVPAMGYLSQLIRARADYAQDAETYKRRSLKPTNGALRCSLRPRLLVRPPHQIRSAWAARSRRRSFSGRCSRYFPWPCRLGFRELFVSTSSSEKTVGSGRSRCSVVIL